jgi:hypothetical protein
MGFTSVFVIFAGLANKKSMVTSPINSIKNFEVK